MHSSEPSQRWLSGRGCAQKVLCWRSICVYSMLCLAALPNPAESVRARCGRELVADLVFVCGDRGLYFGKARNGPPAGKGIVDQCCRKGCDLQHLEAYCAKPKRSRRYAPPTPEQVMEEQFQGVFQRQIMKHFDQEAGHGEERQTYRDKVHHQHKREPEGALLREIYTEHHTSRASSDPRNPLKATTQPS